MAVISTVEKQHGDDRTFMYRRSDPAGPLDSIEINVPSDHMQNQVGVRLFDVSGDPIAPAVETGVVTVTVQTINSGQYEAIEETVDIAVLDTTGWTGHTQKVKAAVTTPFSAGVTTWQIVVTSNKN